MNPPDYSPLHTKITAEHLQRLACIYIRQSSLQQVERNRESQFNQYQLVERAQALGWSQDRLRVIDADLGLSGRGSDYRQGFQELLAEVSLGHVGIIFGYEVSRLARNNSDWYHLLDLAAVFGTLIADQDGVYDPRLYNDRLLLGLKGTMSEAELHLLRLHLNAGRLSAVRRGVYRQHLPTGLLRLPDGTVVKDPDDQVRHTIELVLAKFEDLGSCQQVLRYLRQENILLPRHQTSGFYKGQLLWKPPSDSAIYEIILNPAYAGAFVYGRRPLDPARQQPGRRATGQVHKPMAEWLHLQRDVYPAYITWEQYLANQARLHQNATRFAEKIQQAQGAPGEGAALLQGLATCGLCGHRMHVDYKFTPRYCCEALARHFGGQSCASLHGPSIEAVVVQAFFEALRPAQLDALEAILAAQRAERDQLTRHWEERLKRATYQAQLAQRQYDAVDPAHRLVAGELEKRWEEKLRDLQVTQEAYDRFQQSPPPPALPPELREQFQHISETLPTLWHSGQLTSAQKKELLRSLMARVILKRTAPDTIEVKIVWISGHYSVVSARPPIHREQDVTGYEAMVARVRELWQQGLDDEHIALQLAVEGFHSARAQGVSPVAVQKIRLKHGWHCLLHQSRNALQLNGQLTARGLAARLGVEHTWVYRRIYSGVIDPKYVSRTPGSAVWLIRDEPELIEHLRQLLPANLRTPRGI
jgi:DNA invertase Pin-like site-specific DNA recombinase